MTLRVGRELDPEGRVLTGGVTITLDEHDLELIRATQRTRRELAATVETAQTDVELGVPHDRAFETIDNPYTQLPITCHEVGGVLVDGRLGAVYRRRGLRGIEPVMESFLSWRLAARFKAAPWRPGYSKPTSHVSGPTCSLLGVRSQANLYHFLVEALPRALCVLDHPEPITLLVPSERSSFWQPYLDGLVDRHGFVIRPVTDDELLAVDRMLLIDLGTRDMCGYVDPKIADRLRSLMVDRFGPPARPGRRIYLSRSQAGRRAVSNETELLPILDELDFEILRPEAMSYGEQYRHFAEASVVVGAHGAALANLVHAPPTTRVLVLHGAAQPMPHYTIMALALGMRPSHLLGPMAGDDGDFLIDTERLADRLEPLLPVAGPGQITNDRH